MNGNPSGTTPIESPSGLDLAPKPPNPIRVSKRAGALVFVVGTLILGLFAYGGYRRQKMQQAAIRDLAPKNLAPAISAGNEISKSVPSGHLPTAGQLPVPALDGAADANTALVPPEEARARQGAERVVVRQPAARLNRPQAVPPLPTHTPTPEEQELAAAYAKEQQALAAPTAARFGGWSVDPQRENAAVRPGADSTGGAAALMDAIARRTGAGSPSSAALLAGSPAHSGTRPSDYDDANMQERKEAFLSSARASKTEDYLKSTRTPPLSQYEIKAGWEIPAVLEQGINSDLPGEIKALVTSNVYDTASGQFLLIPQGSRLLGGYDSHVGYGQDGIQVVWNRLIYPDGSSIDLDGMMGLDAQGNAGLRYRVDHHYKRLVGFAVLTSLFTGAFELSQSRRRSVLAYPSPGEIAGSAVGQEVSQLGAQITRRNLNVQPTIKIPVGYKFNVRVNRDILFEAPYSPLPASQ